MKSLKDLLKNHSPHFKNSKIIKIDQISNIHCSVKKLFVEIASPQPLRSWSLLKKIHRERGTPIHDGEAQREETIANVGLLFEITKKRSVIQDIILGKYIKSPIRLSRYIWNLIHTNFICQPTKFDVLNSIEQSKIEF